MKRASTMVCKVANSLFSTIVVPKVKPPKPLEWNLTVENGQLMKNRVPSEWFDPKAVVLSIEREHRAYHVAADEFEAKEKYEALQSSGLRTR